MVELQSRSGVTATAITPPLPQVVGYIIVVVVGLIIALVMMVITRVLNRTVGEDNKKTEMFMTANRTVRTGLTSSAVVSSWLWTTAMLGPGLVGYTYGMAGPFWFAAGCSPMIVFFALLGVSCKNKIPEAHTSLEVVRVRYGRVAHLVFMALCLVNNIFACANMLLGAAAAISAMTGMHVIAATFLLPVGVSIYTFVGGIKATFLTDYFHTVVILIIACYFSIKVFTYDQIGSVGNLYELVKQASIRNPVSGNEQGTYLTMTSKGAILFGIIHICSNFGLVIMDTSYFIKAFSAAPSSVVPGYTIGGIAYFGIPWALGTLMSSVALGLENNPVFPTYPRRMTETEVNAGLVLPYAALTIAGKGGAAAIVLITFMAVTSTLSAQVIAVSSIISFDMYREYFNKSASDKQVIRWSHFGVVFFSLFAAGFSTMLHYVGIDLQWTLYMLGVVTCPGIFPMAFTILWRRQSKAAAILAPILGFGTGLGVWLGTAQAFYGEVSVTSTGQVLPCVYGTVASAFSPIPYSVIITLLKPQNYDWSDFKKEHLALEKLESDLTTAHHDERAAVREETAPITPPTRNEFKRWGRIAAFWSAATFLGHWVIWPLPMYGSHYVFEKGFFAAWVIVAIIWLWLTMLMATFYPLIDGGIQQIGQIIRGLRQGAPIYGGKKSGDSPSSSFTESGVDQANVQNGAAPKSKE
ncbi:urea active transporter [Paecilomyces variotii No. 5]|uniref:Urea active transporter n=1 Tax=Byssochlamys spectabilis (strain No. 5 / NBRC 109023) TaxID=1356009 RepID=V5FUF9_BYSSN|nr:urea active transporter [Paecilomyces variotii No. 5]